MHNYVKHAKLIHKSSVFLLFFFFWQARTNFSKVNIYIKNDIIHSMLNGLKLLHAFA